MDNPSTLLVVRDLLVSKSFYVDTLGLQLVEEHKDCLKLKSGSHNVFMFHPMKTGRYAAFKDPSGIVNELMELLT